MRQEQIKKIANILNTKYPGTVSYMTELAEHLVDAGIGDKDRFSITVKGIDKEVNPDAYYIKPISYKDKA